DDAAHAAAVAHLVAARGAEALDRLPREAEVRGVEALAVAGEVEAAFVAEVERELLAHGQTIREAEDREAVGAVDAVLDLVARVEVGEAAELGLDADGRLAARARGGEARGRRVADGHDGRGGPAPGEIGRA